jgi:hypothetical protein
MEINALLTSLSKNMKAKIGGTVYYKAISKLTLKRLNQKTQSCQILMEKLEALLKK